MPETDASLQTYDSEALWSSIAEVRKHLALPQVVLRSKLVKVPELDGEVFSVLGSLIYEALRRAETESASRTPSECIEAVALDLEQLAVALAEIETMPKLRRRFAERVAEERKIIVSAMLRLERLARPGLRRSGKMDGRKNRP